jgi:hypothetical protein
MFDGGAVPVSTKLSVDTFAWVTDACSDGVLMTVSAAPMLKMSIVAL